MISRAEFLGRIRVEMARTPGLFEATPSARPARPRERLEVLRRELSERWPESLARFVREFERVGGVFHRVTRVTEVPDVIASIAAEREMRRVVSWHPDALRLDLAGPLTGRGLQISAMPGVEVMAAERERLRGVVAAAELGVTGVDLAVAETGTLVVVSGAGRPRSTSLLPACHAAVFDREVLVESLAQLGLVLEAWHEGSASDARGAAINFITGPSRTADIELTLTRGVHGPKEVHAVFVEDGLGGGPRG
jgi:L-lactate dehydrogenase complex protein LldG